MSTHLLTEYPDKILEVSLPWTSNPCRRNKHYSKSLPAAAIKINSGWMAHLFRRQTLSVFLSTVIIIVGSLRKPRRQRQRERH